jgi:hypothetical protein
VIVREFLGHPVDYWMELDRRFTEDGAPDRSALLQEVVDLRGKVAFYESRIEQMATLLPRRSPGAG